MYQFGNIIITSKSEQNSQQEELVKYLAGEIEKIHVEKTQEVTEKVGNKTDSKKVEVPTVQTLNKNTSYFGNPFATYLSKDRVVKEVADLETIRFWANEIPRAPQTIEFIVKSVLSRGAVIKLRPGKKGNLELKRKIEKFFFKRANQNKTSFIEILKTIFRHCLQTGDGFGEKVRTRDKTKLAEMYMVDPSNMIVLKDEDEAERGVLRVTGYAKVKNQNKVDVKKLPKNAILKTEDVLHVKYIDEGDAYGHSAFEKNQEMSRFIINVMNLNQKKFTNEIRHSLWIKMGKKATMADANMFLAQYRANYLGKYNYAKPLITFGDIEVERWDLPDKDFDYREFMKEIGLKHAPSLFNVSPSEIENTDSTYSNASQGHITTILLTIIPWQIRMEEIVNSEIIPELEGLSPDSDAESTYIFELKKENIHLYTMYQYIVAFTNAIKSGLMTPNEARTALDPSAFPQVPEDWANAFYMVLGNELRVASEEFFAGTDSVENLDGTTKAVNMNGFFNNKESKNTDKK